MSETLKKQPTKIFQKKVKALTQKKSVIDKIAEKPNMKKDFIDKYGVQMEMPANYIIQSFYYQPDQRYLINTSTQVFPDNIEFYDYDKIGTKEDPTKNENIDRYREISNKIIFKVFSIQDLKYQELKIRVCDSSYQKQLCFSRDKRKLAIFRREIPSDGSNESIFQRHNHYVIDIFDCSSIDFFLRDEPLTPNDKNLLFTIKDDFLSQNVNSEQKLEQVYMRIGTGQKQLLVQLQQKILLLYDFVNKQGSNIVTKAEVNIKLPPQYEMILNVALHEKDILESILAVKRTDFRNIDIIPLGLILELSNKSIQESRHTLTSAQIQEIQQRYIISSIRLQDFNPKSTLLKFSKDHSHVIFCDDNQNLVLQLATKNTKQHQSTLNHLQGKKCREITRYGQQDFLVSTADSLDSEVTIRHSSDISKKIKFYIRYVENTVKIQDVLASGDKLKILVTRDDEEIVVYEYENFEKETFWQRFYESSNYIFEWPYLCYLKDQMIIVQNGFNPNKAIFIKMPNLAEHDNISHIYLSESYLLYFVVSTKTEYQFYERDLDKCISVLLKQKQQDAGQLEIKAESSILPSQLKSKLFVKVQRNLDKPFATISKHFLNYKSLYKIFVRSSSNKEIISSNLERMVFIICDFKIYCISSASTEPVLVAKGYKFKQINPELVAFNTVDDKGRKTNIIKFLRIGYSEYQVTKAHEEMDGKVVEFQVQEQQMLLLTKPQNSEVYCLKIFDIVNGMQVKFKSQITVTDEILIGSFQTTEQIQNNLIPSGNNIFQIIQQANSTRILYYKDVLPINPQVGEQPLFFSPLINMTYRKMIYFVSNKQLQKPKQAIIMPYINDNFVLFNKRENMTHYCQLYEHRNLRTMEDQIEILNLVPFTQALIHYTIDGKILSITKLKKIYQEYGDHCLAISPNGKLFLQHFDEDLEYKQATILRIQISTRDAVDFASQDTSPQIKSMNALKNFQTVSFMKKKPQQQPDGLHTESYVDIQALEIINFDQIPVNDEVYRQLKKFNLNEIIQFYKTNSCEVVIKMNDNQDLLIGFFTKNLSVGKNQRNVTKNLKELLYLQKSADQQRQLFRIRLSEHQDGEDEAIISAVQGYDSQKSKDQTNIHGTDILKKNLRIGLLSQTQETDGGHNESIKMQANKDFDFFLLNQELKQCIDFQITDDKILVWTTHQIFFYDLQKNLKDQGNVIDESVLHLEKVLFEIEESEEHYIQSISLHGQNEQDKKLENYYIYIKVINEDQSAFFIKYNINKMKEFSSFDCSKSAQAFFDKNFEGFILDEDSIIDIDQGIPLYFYKTGMRNYNTQYIMGGQIDRGSRFCSKNNHFLIRNRLYIPYSYLAFIIIENNKGKALNSNSYDPDAFFCINGNTALHTLANNYKDLEFILSEYEKFNPKLINLILLDNKEGKNVLEIAMEANNSRCVNLILDKISRISINNIHALKDRFSELLDYNGFEDYLKLCFFQTNQMKAKSIFQRKSDQDENFYIGPHKMSFLDSSFYDKFQDKSNPMKPVQIRALDAGWLLKYNQGPGQEFLQKLSCSDDMKYFQIDTIKLIVNYQWKIMKPLIIKWLFLPFIINMILYCVYCVYLFENLVSSGDHTSVKTITLITQMILLLFTIQTFYVEYKQITFHKESYLSSFWNLMDLTTAILAPLTVIMHLMDIDSHTIRPFMAICNLIFFLRFFYFLRIFDSSSHLVRTIIEITYDIRHFLYVFNLGVLGFGGSFQILSNNIDESATQITTNSDGTTTTTNLQERFVESFWDAAIYSYRLSLGDFDTDNFSKTNDQVLVWILFIISSMFTAIILLNMLVAIMGESFNRVNETSESQRVREHLQLIVENDFLIDRKKMFKDVKYLIEIKDDVQDDQSDSVLKLIQDVEQRNNKRLQVQEQSQSEIKEILKQSTAQMSMLKNDVCQLKELIKRQLAEQQLDGSLSRILNTTNQSL